MFQSPARPKRTILSVVELIYHSVVRDIRKSHRNAFMGLFLNMMQTIVFVLTFFVMFELLGLRGAAIRG
ncbi:MAG: ABC transporter permease, partial [Paracoccaceae bacterium]